MSRNLSTDDLLLKYSYLFSKPFWSKMIKNVLDFFASFQKIIRESYFEGLSTWHTRHTQKRCKFRHFVEILVTLGNSSATARVGCYLEREDLTHVKQQRYQFKASFFVTNRPNRIYFTWNFHLLFLLKIIRENFLIDS